MNPSYLDLLNAFFSALIIEYFLNMRRQNNETERMLKLLELILNERDNERQRRAQIQIEPELAQDNRNTIIKND